MNDKIKLIFGETIAILLWQLNLGFLKKSLVHQIRNKVFENI